MQSVLAANVAVPDVNVSFAVAVPEFEAAAENVVEPQPLVEGDSEFANVKPGRTTSMMSEVFMATFSERPMDTADGAAVTGFVIVT